MKLVILAAGVGSRLGQGLPKALVEIGDYRTILDLQIENFSSIIGIDNIILVVGYKKEAIMERYPQLVYVYNPDYLTTNTSKSLLSALKKIKNEDVIFINGDIVFTKQTAKDISESIKTSFMVNSEKTADEEVKYKLDDDGNICELSKDVINACGEAVGINYIEEKDLETVKKALSAVNDMDYFEKAFENLILNGEIVVSPLDINEEFVKEIDFPEDLQEVKDYLLDKFK
jgi:choline kinase